MERTTLSSSQIDPEALKFINKNHADIVGEVIAAITKGKIVVVGMAQNPVVKKAKRLLKENNREYTFLSYGSYFSMWQQRLAIKLWSGWPTFPQVFIEGKLVGGAAELEKYLAK